MAGVLYDDKGMPVDAFIPERPNGNDQTRTVFSVPNSGVSMSSFDTVNESDDIFKGKHFKIIAGPSIGETIKAERMIKEKNLYYVLFDNGQKIPVLEINGLMVEINSPGIEDMKPSQFIQNNVDRKPREQTVIFDPVTEILKKRKKKTTNINLSLNLDIPPKELYQILLEDYENAEEKIIEYLLTPENLELIKNDIKESLRQFYGIKHE